jgi:hypothetical protein
MAVARRSVGALLVCAALIPACSQPGAEAPHLEEPAEMEPIEGTELSRITLSADASRRLDVQVAEVLQLEGRLGLEVPHSALLYDSDGGAWVYVETEPLAYVRHAVTVDRVEDERVFLHDGPPAGSRVVTVGTVELYGVESGVGGGH